MDHSLRETEAAWHVSLTARWSELRGDTKRLFDGCAAVPVSPAKVRVTERALHSTLFAFARIARPLLPHTTLRDSARSLLDEFRRQGVFDALVGRLARARVRPKLVRHFANETTIQFEVINEGDLTALRATVLSELRRRGLELDRDDVQIPGRGDAKVEGPLLWGSIARRATPVPINVLEDEHEFPDPSLELMVVKSITTLSDDWLAQEPRLGDEDPLELVDPAARR